jgi:hypothetical protein
MDMENKKVLFITFDMSGYYDGVLKELQKRYSHVDYYNTATFKFRYKNFGQKAYSFFYKLFTGKKLKNYYKYNSLVQQVAGNTYDITLVVRPDLFFDPQLQVLKNISGRFIAYYHDSINNIKRKKHVIHFFDKVYSYEKKDVNDHDLKFISNFIYFDTPQDMPQPQVDAFSVMSDDYRVATLKKLAGSLKQKQRSYRFFVMKDGELPSDSPVTYVNKRMNNDEVVQQIKEARIIADIHKYGIQDGLTFRVFEAMGFRKKLITTNRDIKTYDLYNPNNIFVIEDNKTIDIPDAFFDTPYEEIPADIYKRYTIPAWLDEVLS